MFGLKIITEPTEEPVILAEAKAQLRVAEAIHHEDQRIQSLIKAARRYVETFTGRALLTQKLQLTLDRFPAGCIRLPKPPLQSITADEDENEDLGVSYIDANEVSQTLVLGTDYRADTFSEPGRLEPIDTWPATDERMAAVTITYLAGYSATSAVPEEVKLAMLLLVKDWYEDGEARISDTVQKRAADLMRQAWAGSLIGTFG